MCDETTAADNDRAAPTRRAFGIGVGAAGLAALLPSPAAAMTVAGRDVTIPTPDGSADAWFVAPTRGRHPGVLIWPDIMGLRPAFRQMAQRLAESGYAVLVVNQFYRSTRAPFLAPGESFDQPAVRARIMPWRTPLTPAATTADARAFVGWLDTQRQVDTRRGMAVTGYCMGGPMMVRTAAARPDRVRAGASFHGGGLVGDAADSPDKLVPQLRGGYLFAVAQNDDARAPQDKELLRAAFAAARVPAEIEVYPADHGWCPPDSRAYDRVQAERAWSRQLALFTTQLGGDDRMTLTLYTNPQSRGRIARWMLEEVGAPYETVVLGYTDTMKGDDYRAINPMMKVPAIRHDGRVVTETAAICAYLADAFPEAGLAPATPDERAAYHRWMFFAAGPMEAAVADRAMKVAPDGDQQRMAGYGHFDLAAGVLEQAIDGRTYITGDRFTAADVYVGSSILWYTRFGMLPKTPAFTTYLERIEARPAFRRANALDDAAAS